MSKVLIKSSTLTDIANAIRAKDGSTAQMYPSEMAEKIGAISTGEKRIIPTSFIYNSSDGANIAGTGTVYLKAGNSVKIDGKSYSAISGTTYRGVERGVPVRFKTSLVSSHKPLPIIVGNETDVKLEGAPKSIITAYGYTLPDAGVSVNGKGYAILYCDSDIQIGAITVDGHRISKNLTLNNGWEIRFDFNESFKIANRDIDSRYSPYWQIVVF